MILGRTDKIKNKKTTSISLGFFEKPTITWEEYWKKNS